MTEAKELRLHLGCGENYLDGYTNIDYPPTEHTVMQRVKVDEYADILKLQYAPESVDEVRLHHVFEHFSRDIAAALLASWWSWLKVGGVVYIEVPDFDKNAKTVLSRFASKKSKMMALRHIFGSNEADWAVHYEGWSSERLAALLKDFGYEPFEVNKIEWRGTYNFQIKARKFDGGLKKNEFEKKAQNYLALFLIDEVVEKPLLKVWMDRYRKQIKQTWAK